MLFNCLKTLSNQTYSNDDFEVIIVDDGSPESLSEEICNNDFGIKIKYLYYDRTEKSCASFARNRGIENSTGELLIFLDCDQMVDSNFISEHILFHNSSAFKEGIIEVGTRKKIRDGQDINIDNYKQLQFDRDVRFKVFDIFSSNFAFLKGNWHLVFSHNILMPRRLLEKCGGFDENFKGWGLEDCELAYRLKKNGAAIVYNPNIEAYHQFHNEIHNQNRYIQWIKNLEYFVSKHNELQVMMQYVFCDFFDPQKRQTLINNGIENVWVNCYTRFENALRIIEGNNSGL
jgi:GT2 family glycosyltransferase